MIQEIIVFILFFSIIGISLYRFFFSTKNTPSGGCNKCASNPQGSLKKEEWKKEQAHKQ